MYTANSKHRFLVLIFTPFLLTGPDLSWSQGRQPPLPAGLEYPVVLYLNRQGSFAPLDYVNLRWQRGLEPDEIQQPEFAGFVEIRADGHIVLGKAPTLSGDYLVWSSRSRFGLSEVDMNQSIDRDSEFITFPGRPHRHSLNQTLVPPDDPAYPETLRRYLEDEFFVTVHFTNGVEADADWRPEIPQIFSPTQSEIEYMLSMRDWYYEQGLLPLRE